MSRKKYMFITALAALLLIPPLVVFAAVNSSVRKNSFSEGSDEAVIIEGNQSGVSIENDSYSFTQSDSDYIAAKTVEIKAPKTSSDEYLRVRFVPMWYDESGNVTGGIEISDMKITQLSADRKSLQLCTKNAQNEPEPVITLKLNENWESYWTFNSGERCFYSKSLVRSGETTPALLEQVMISSDTYSKTEVCTLRIDVLADAVQKTDNAYSDRSWNPSDG